MNKTKLSFIALAITSAFVSCTNENEGANNASSEYIKTVRVTVEDFIPETPATRTAYTVDGTGFHFSWAEGDALGIYPVGGDQVKFPISNGGGSKSASFDGGSWRLRSNYKYAAYYPFSTANYTISQTALPVSYTGQTQNGNNSTSHVGAYDYLASAATQPDASGGVNMQMKQLGAFLRLQLTMPKADTYSSVVLESDGAKFVTTGTFDLTSATPAITATATSSKYTIGLTNVSTTAANQMITVYALVAPADLSAANIKITVDGAGGKYVKTVTGKKFLTGSAYNFAAELNSASTATTENGHEYVDLGLSVKWATMNVGATEVAGSNNNSYTGRLNCYGNYYAWGELDLKNDYSWATYEFTKEVDKYGYSATFTKYVATSTYGTVDDIKVLEPNHDVAQYLWGGKWRMPTEAEQDELLNNCYWEWTSSYKDSGVAGYIVYKVKNDSDKGKFTNDYKSPTIAASYSLSDVHIFLPAAGCINGTSYTVTVGFYWSSSLYEDESDKASCFKIENSYAKTGWETQDRYIGQSVRAVCP